MVLHYSAWNLIKGIKNVLSASKRLPAEPNGELYVGAGQRFGDGDHAYRLTEGGRLRVYQKLGVLGERRMVPRTDFYAGSTKRYPTPIYTVNHERAEQILERLDKISKERAKLDTRRYRTMEEKVAHVRIVLEELTDN